MEIIKALNGNIYNISLRGKFTFSDHSEFKKIFEVLKSEPNIREVNLNFEEVEYVDSAALGLLLLLKEEIENTSRKLSLNGVNGQVQKMFEISRFYEMFNIR